MRWVAEGAEIGVMRRDDNGVAAWCKQPVKFFNRAYDVSDVLDHMDGSDLAKRAISEGKRKMVEIGYYIRSGARVAVHADSSRMFVNSAADIENRKPHFRRG